MSFVVNKHNARQVRKCPSVTFPAPSNSVIMSHFNRNVNVSANFATNNKYEFSQKFVQWASHFCEDSQVDRHDKANGHFCKRMTNSPINASWHTVPRSHRRPRNISPPKYLHLTVSVSVTRSSIASYSNIVKDM